MLICSFEWHIAPSSSGLRGRALYAVCIEIDSRWACRLKTYFLNVARYNIDAIIFNADEGHAASTPDRSSGTRQVNRLLDQFTRRASSVKSEASTHGVSQIKGQGEQEQSR